MEWTDRHLSEDEAQSANVKNGAGKTAQWGEHQLGKSTDPSPDPGTHRKQR